MAVKFLILLNRGVHHTHCTLWYKLTEQIKFWQCHICGFKAHDPCLLRVQSAVTNFVCSSCVRQLQLDVDTAEKHVEFDDKV
jgi:transcription elongation factor Elf1